MDAKHRKILQVNQVYLLSNVTYLDICDHLMEKGLVSYDKHEEISAEKGNRAMMRALLGHLPKGGPHAFDAFVSIFQECDPPVPHVVEKLCPQGFDTVDSKKKVDMNANQPPAEPASNLFHQPHPLAHAPPHAFANYSSSIARPAGGEPKSTVNVDATPVLPATGASAEPAPLPSHVPLPETVPNVGGLKISDEKESDWFYTSLSESHRLMLCKDKLFAKLSQKIPGIPHLGIWLGFDKGEINQIQHGNAFSVPSQVLELLQRWKQRVKDHTVEKLVHALREADIPESSYQQAILDFSRGKYN